MPLKPLIAHRDLCPNWLVLSSEQLGQLLYSALLSTCRFHLSGYSTNPRRDDFRQGIKMLQQMLNAIAQNPWIIAAGTVVFFATKGCLWLLVPFLLVRWRRLTLQRRVKNEVSVAESPANSTAATLVSRSEQVG